MNEKNKKDLENFTRFTNLIFEEIKNAVKATANGKKKVRVDELLSVIDYLERGVWKGIAESITKNKD